MAQVLQKQVQAMKVGLQGQRTSLATDVETAMEESAKHIRALAAHCQTTLTDKVEIQRKNRALYNEVP